MTEADAGLPESTEAALSLSTARLGGAPQEAGSADGEDPKTAQATAAQPTPATPTAEPTGGAKADFSWVQDAELRAGLEATGSVKVAKWLKDFQGTHTQKSQEATRLAKEVQDLQAERDGLKSKAQLAEAIEADDDLAAAVATALAAKRSKKPAVEVDLTQASDAEIKAYIAQVREDAKADALAQAKAFLTETLVTPRQREQAILSKAASMYDGWKDRFTKEEFTKAWDHTVQHFGGSSITPENAEGYFTLVLNHEATAKELASLKTAQAASAAQAARATSPAGTSGVASSAVKVTEKKPDGKPETAREKTLEWLREVRGYTPDILEEAARFRA